MSRKCWFIKRIDFGQLFLLFKCLKTEFVNLHNILNLMKVNEH